MSKMLSDEALDTIFRQARSHNLWSEEDVSQTLMRAAYDLAKWGPTSANCSPARYVFLVSKAAKERIKPHLSPNNVHKVMTAAACVIIAYDTEFYEQLPKLFPHNPGAREWFTADSKVAAATAFRNGTLQGAYFMIAARALGLDCGPMSGFNNEGVDREFFPDGKLKSNFICSIGHGDPKGLFPRSPRLTFDEACKIL
jgi:3-hydroxypropanoate dehydrogenase